MPQPQKTWKRFAWILAAWTLLGLFVFTQHYAMRTRLGHPLNFFDMFIESVGLCWLWALATPLILRLAGKYRIERPLLLRHALLHVLASLVFSISLKILHDYLMYGLHYLQTSEWKYSLSRSVFQIYTYFDYWIFIYWFILAALYATEYSRRLREKELVSAQLETRLVQAQLSALRSQLNPHFLFNTLHSISALMYRDVSAANRMISQLSDLLRLSLETGGAQEVPLKQELDFIERYLLIQQARFSDRLQVRFAVEPEVLDALVPNFVLQPLVENAVGHGVAALTAGGVIQVSARRVAEQLVLDVSDNGPGFPVSWSPAFREGLGLNNTRERLKRMYQGEHRFEMRNAPDGGAVVSILLPFRQKPAGELSEAGSRDAVEQPEAGAAGETEPALPAEAAPRAAPLAWRRGA